MTADANPGLAAASQRAPITVIADPADCAFQFDPVGKSAFNSSCDIAKSYLARAGLPYRNEAAPSGTLARVTVGDAVLASFDGHALEKGQLATQRAAWEAQAAARLTQAGYPAASDSATVNKPMVVAILAILMIYVAMVYGPIAAMLVEMFPAAIRYTSMSLPYHIGNGWFGGFLPTTSFAMVAASGDIFYGLWYPVIVACLTFLIGLFFIRETRHANIDA